MFQQETAGVLAETSVTPTPVRRAFGAMLVAAVAVVFYLTWSRQRSGPPAQHAGAFIMNLSVLIFGLAVFLHQPPKRFLVRIAAVLTVAGAILMVFGG